MATADCGYPKKPATAAPPARPLSRPPRAPAWTLALAALLLLPVPFLTSSHAPPVATPTVSGNSSGLPVAADTVALRSVLGSFTENRGQVGNAEVRYSLVVGNLHIGMVTSGLLIEMLAPAPGTSTALVPQGSDASGMDGEAAPPMNTAVIRVAFEGSNRVQPQGREELPFRSSYFSGKDPSKWQVGIRGYREVVYPDLYSGIDLVFHAGDSGLKYEFLVRPGADPGQIRWSYAGVDGVEVRDGALAARTDVGELADAAPVAYQAGGSIPCRYSLEGRSVGLACGAWNPANPLTIDPLLYSTFLGGRQDSRGTAIAVDAAGNAYVAGFTMSVDFPTTIGAYQTSLRGAGTWDAFVVKLDRTGTGPVYSTFLGGLGNDRAFALAVDGSGDAYVTGYTNSTNFPTTPGAFRTTFTSAVMEAFVTELNPTGSALVYSTFLGGTGDDRAYAITLDASGEAFVAGRTKSPDFPLTAGAFETTFKSTACGLTLCGHGFISKLNPTGNGLVYSSFLGGTFSDRGLGVAVDSSGAAYVGGYTNSSDFPVTPGAFQTAFHGGACGSFLCSEAFVAKVNPAGTALVYSTLLGGSKTDHVHEIAIDASGNAFVTGETNSTDFPVTAGAYEAKSPGGAGPHAFVTELNAMGSGLVYSTFLGGSNADHGHGIAVDAYGDAVVVGRTNSSDFPTTPGAYDTALNPAPTNDVFVTELAASGGQLLYSTFFGGTADDWGNAIALDAAADAYITGHSFSLNFPTTPGAFQTAFTGIAEAFVAKLSLALAPTVRIMSPGSGAVATTAVTVTGTSARATGVQVRPGSGSWTNATGVASWTATLDLSPLPNGAIVIESRALSGTLVSAIDSVTIQKASAGLGLDRCTVRPDVVAIQVGLGQAFAAVGWNGTTEIAGVTATWSSSGNLGNVSPAGVFTATAPGVGSVTASAGYGGRSARCSASVTVTTGPPPTVGITSPSSGSNVTTDIFVVRGVSANADAVQLRAGTEPWLNVTGNLAAWSASLDLSAFPDGRALSVEARSFNGTVESTHDRITIVKVLQLVVTISYPLDRASVSGTLTVSGNATIGSTVQVRFDSGPWQNVSLAGSTWAYVLDTTATFDGAHLIEARAVNGTGSSAIVAREILVSNRQSPVPILSPPLLWGFAVASGFAALVLIVLRRRKRRRRREAAFAGVPPSRGRPD